ncbi:hypothetical protein THAOC_19192, partial [Thalassiosira oceanica]
MASAETRLSVSVADPSAKDDNNT